MTAPAATDPEPDEPEHVCKPGATVYYCPTSGDTESDCHGGFDQCCERPDLHRPVSTVLRDGLATALLARIKRATVSPAQPFDAVTSLLAATEFDLADTALGALTEYLDIGDAEAWCKTCRRVWDGPRHRCESDAEQRLAAIREALASFNDRGVIRVGYSNLDIPTASEVIAAVRAELDGDEQSPRTTAKNPATSGDTPDPTTGPSVRECAQADRVWPLQREGE